jgi:hypothetical protein
MSRVSRRAIAACALAIALVAAACDGSSGTPAASPPPSGALGPVTPDAAAEAVRGLCDMAGDPDRDAAATTFFDRSHQTLHVLAAAAEVADRAAAARLLEAKQAIEADLREPVLPEAFGDHLDALLDATRGALDAIGLDAPACPP